MRHRIVTQKRTWFQSLFVTGLLLIGVIWGTVAVVRAFMKQHEAVRNRNNAMRELEQSDQKQVELSAKIENLSTERGIEAEIRNQYRVAKPGEQLVIVVDNEEGIESSAEKRSFWQKLRQFVGL